MTTAMVVVAMALVGGIAWRIGLGVGRRQVDPIRSIPDDRPARVLNLQAAGAKVTFKPGLDAPHSEAQASAAAKAADLRAVARRKIEASASTPSRVSRVSAFRRHGGWS